MEDKTWGFIKCFAVSCEIQLELPMRVKDRYKFMEGFSPEVKGREGGLFFADPICPVPSSIPDRMLNAGASTSPSRQLPKGTVRGGDDSAIQGMVSTMEIEPDPRRRR